MGTAGNVWDDSRHLLCSVRDPRSRRVRRRALGRSRARRLKVVLRVCHLLAPVRHSQDHTPLTSEFKVLNQNRTFRKVRF